ncbi:HNH endonuclease [Aminobacter carboxidus]|uniref:HNH endonuclease n=1 Tax=Aminobacter carboxidus TaxID=376165 RepID=A0ABR9GWS3_9HYPH|nr:HNH endonuclease [Aminobacter carboxidus]MBE1208123.1 HNH endonuclease [Aminobacter carboxidus]
MAKLRMIAPTLRTMDTRTVRPPAKTADAFYLSTEWRALMSSLIATRGRICEDPHCNGRTHKPGMRVFGDHIVELQDGGAPLDPKNVLLRCGASHTKKTAAARAKRMKQTF